MRAIAAAKGPHGNDPMSSSRRHFRWPVLGKSGSRGAGAASGDEGYVRGSEAEEEEEEDERAMAFSSACPSFHSEDFVSPPKKPVTGTAAPAQEKQQQRRKVRTAEIGRAHV